MGNGKWEKRREEFEEKGVDWTDEENQGGARKGRQRESVERVHTSTRRPCTL